MALNETVVDDVANSNFKTVAGQPAQLANLALGNAIAFQHAMNQNTLALTSVLTAGTGRMMRSQTELDPEEARSAGLVTNTLTDIASEVAAIRQFLPAVASGGSGS